MQNVNRGKQRGKPRGIRRDRDCRTCKLRGVKCDLNRPKCLPCVRAGLACGDYPQRVIWAEATGTEDATVKSIPRAPSIDVISAREYTISGGSKLLLRNPSPEQDQRALFINRLAHFCQQITVIDGRGPHSGLCLSEKATRMLSHLHDYIIQARIGRCAIVLNDGEMAGSADAARHRLAVLEHLNEALKTADPLAILGIATFAVFEVCERPFGDWQRHIYGAKSLLDHHCVSRLELDRLSQNVPGLIEIVSRLVWFDVMGAVVRGTIGLTFDDWHLQLLDDSFFGFVGCPVDTYNLFVRVAKGEVDIDPLNNCLKAMEQLSRLGAGYSDWDQCANAFRCAAAIAVLSRIHDTTVELSRQATLVSAVTRLCQVIASIPSSSPFYVHLGVPAYLAGINATDIQQCDIVHNYLAMLQTCRRSPICRWLDQVQRKLGAKGLKSRTRAV